MQEAHELLNMLAEVVPMAAPAHRQDHADPRVAQYVSPERPDAHEYSIEILRNAVADLLYAIRRAFEETPDEAYGYVSHAAELLLTDTARAVAGLNLLDTEAVASPNPRGGLAASMIRKVSTYIETHLNSAISTADLATLAKLSTYHFIRAFRQSFDEPLRGYVMRRRVERAQGLMLQTNLPLSQIAIECGLADQSHLNKLFRRLVGESPDAWRRARAVAPP
jgi:AraC family transcriptional regulator